jgi:hypothetical protein
MKNLSNNQMVFSVLISLGNSSGSGFIYRTNSQYYLVTAKHVLFDEKSTLRSKEIEIVGQSKDIFDDTVNRLRIDLSVVPYKYHKKFDVTIVEIGAHLDEENNAVFLLNEGVESIENATTKLVYASKKVTSTLAEVIISNDIYISGYPTSLGIELSPQFDLNKPLLRKGIVASINTKAQTIILDCPVYFGNSGGPVVQVTYENEKKRVKLIGVVSQFIPYVQKWRNDRDQLTHIEHLNSGYSVAVSMDCVLELIDQMETS